MFSRKVDNDETEILQFIAAACETADEVRWAVDVSGRASTLLLALLVAHGQQVVYVPGRTVHRMSGAYRGEGKTDAKDALVIADTARMRRDFAPLGIPDETVATLRLLTAHRADLIADRVRLINRLRDALVGICPALERVFDYSAAKGPVVMLTEYQTPAALRRNGVKRLTTWLERRKVRGADDVAARAVEAAQSQTTALPGRNGPPSSCATWPTSSSPWTSGSRTPTGRSATPSASTNAPRSSSRSPAWGRSSALNSSRSSATCPVTKAPAVWPPTRAWLRCRVTPAAAPATTTGPSDTIAACAGCSTWPHRPR